MRPTTPQKAAGWRTDPALSKAAATTSWLWAGMFGLRLLVQVPLYLAGAVGALGLARIMMGWPLFLLVAALTYRILHPLIRRLDGTDPETSGVETSGAETSG